MFHLLDEPAPYRDSLAKSISGLADMLLACSLCGNIEAKKQSEKSLCSICADSRRDRKRIALVESAIDLRAIERTRLYNGLYFVLAGPVTPSGDIMLNAERLKALAERVAKESTEEIIIATSPTTEGDATMRYVEKTLAPLNVKLTRLARGLAKGVDLEYVDEDTLREALSGRH